MKKSPESSTLSDAKSHKTEHTEQRIIGLVEAALKSSLGNLHKDIVSKISGEISKVLKEEEFRNMLFVKNMLDSFTDEMVNFQDEDHTILYCNDAFAKFVGFPKNEIIGKKCYEIICNPDKCIKCPIEGIKTGDDSRVYVEYDGIFLEKSANSVNDDNGNFIGYVELYKDRSDLVKQSCLIDEKNKELSKTNEYLSSALNNSKQGAWEWNIQTGEVVADDNFYKILGYNKQEVVFNYDFWESILHPDDKPVVKNELKKSILKAGGSFQFSYRLMNLDGEYIWITASGKVIEYDAKGKPLKAIGTHMDITEITNIKNYLQENEQKLSAILQSIPDLLLVVDKDGNYKEIYTGNSKLFIGPRRSGLNIGDVFDKKNVKIILDGITRTIETKTIQHIDYVLEKKGKIRRYSGNCQALNNEQVVIITRDVTEEKKLQEKVKHMALHDSLTGLSNHFSFNDKLQHTINLAKRSNKKFAVLFIDLDLFKEVNDNHGHAVGDKLLQEVAQRLLSATRGSDVVSRIGGDEFAIILSSLENPDDYEIVAKRILKSLSEPFKIKSDEITIGSSIGISIYPDHGEEVETLVTHADVAMYKVKRGGKNNYFVFEIHKDSE